jgi:hypothetical protein
MKQAIPNIRATVATMRDSLPSFPAAQQGALDKFALSIAAELDILEGAKRDTPVPADTTAKPKAPAAE